MTKSDPSSTASRYRLKFLPAALEEWNALDGSVKEVLRKLLKKRLEQPRMPGAELHGDLRDIWQAREKRTSKWPKSLSPCRGGMKTDRHGLRPSP